MAESEIPPLWLRPAPGPHGERRFRVPALLRLRAMREGLPLVVEAAGAGAPLCLVACDRAGRELTRESLPPAGPAVLFLPRGAALLRLEGGGDLSAARLGYFPVQKVALKLHAFANGVFPDTPPVRRWKAAGVAARTLRGALHARIFASPARQRADAARYRAYRARHVEDFREVPAAAAAPRVSFLSSAEDLPTGNLPAAALARCAAALAAQTDRNFEWVVALAAGRLAADGPALAAAGARVIEAPGPGKAAALAAALAAAQGGLVCVLDPAGRPTRDAVALLRATFARFPDCALAYADEERLDANGTPLRGVFKPAFNLHLLQASGYLCGFAALPRADAVRLGLRASAGEACIYDLMLRHASSLARGRIHHIPRIAFGIGERAPGFSPAEIGPAADALSQLAGVPVEAVAGGRHLRPLFDVPQPAPLVSIVVPTRDRAGLLGTALRSLIATTAYRAFEIVIVDNGSTEAETFALFDEIRRLWPAIHVVRDDGGFNFPRICNLGVEAARGDLILLLNNDVEVVEPGWLGEMVALASLPGAGIVGAKLLFPDRTVQHAGAIVGLFRYADHWFAHSAEDAPGYEDRLLVRQNLSAVTAACLLVRRDVWNAIGPLDAERFAEDCNDIDLCLRARRAGYDVVFTPFARLLHYESASRGRKRSKEHRARLKAQRARMEAIWHNASLVDPHYNPNLDRKSLFAALAAEPDGPREPRTDAV
ncbi:glycosyltransferase family 2 protein [Xanthobacter sp. AM11]|uniref:glycosyltransferase family 2 protein n=1 Tax=Xanthobacter sp. AM11 TaxID=3380643 RepID=UPI0039BEE76E